MRERPILFSAPMIRALLDGRKTVTRRPVRLRYAWEIEEADDGSKWPWHPDYVTGGEWDGWARCPYGEVGDRLWVKETWRVSDRWGAVPPSALPHENGLTVAYAAGGSRAHDDTARFVNDDAYSPWDAEWMGRTRSPIHMPRWASRIALEVTAVRVERLRDITEEQAHAEGVDNHMAAAALGSDSTRGELLPATVHGFAHLWDGLAKPGTRWADNPWVWVVEFKRIEQEAPT